MATNKERLKFWNRIARKALFKSNKKLGNRYYKIYKFCMERRINYITK